MQLNTDNNLGFNFCIVLDIKYLLALNTKS